MSNASPTFKSAAGGYIIFDITDPAFLPGKIPTAFTIEANRSGPWFFQPSTWSVEDHWGGSMISMYTTFPMIYSTAFATAEEALAAADKWEANKADREACWARAHAKVEAA